MSGCERPAASPEVARLVARVLDGGAPLKEHEIVALFHARGADFQVHFLRSTFCVTHRGAQGECTRPATLGVNAATGS